MLKEMILGMKSHHVHGFYIRSLKNMLKFLEKVNDHNNQLL